MEEKELDELDVRYIIKGIPQFFDMGVKERQKLQRLTMKYLTETKTKKRQKLKAKVLDEYRKIDMKPKGVDDIHSIIELQCDVRDKDKAIAIDFVMHDKFCAYRYFDRLEEILTPKKEEKEDIVEEEKTDKKNKRRNKNKDRFIEDEYVEPAQNWRVDEHKDPMTMKDDYSEYIPRRIDNYDYITYDNYTVLQGDDVYTRRVNSVVDLIKDSNYDIENIIKFLNTIYGHLPQDLYEYPSARNGEYIEWVRRYDWFYQDFRKVFLELPKDEQKKCFKLIKKELHPDLIQVGDSLPTPEQLKDIVNKKVESLVLTNDFGYDYPGTGNEGLLPGPLMLMSPKEALLFYRHFRSCVDNNKENVYDFEKSKGYTKDNASAGIKINFAKAIYIVYYKRSSEIEALGMEDNEIALKIMEYFMDPNFLKEIEKYDGDLKCTPSALAETIRKHRPLGYSK